MADYSVGLGHILILGGSVLAAALLALAAKAVHGGLLSRGHARDTAALGVLGPLAILPTVVILVAGKASPGIAEAFGRSFVGRSMSMAVWDFLFVVLAVAAAVMVLVILSVVAWFHWSSATRAGARRRKADWLIAVAGLASGLAAIPLFILMWNS